MRIVLFAVLAIPVFAADLPSVSVTGGQIRGGALEKGGAVFKGIPFAQPPVGDLRWREPGAVKTWTGVREATTFASACAQNAGGRMQANSSEDCLYLNVWTPEWPTRTRKPVMVWLHGGGNYAGTASGNNFDGESLARRGVVLVTVNYRLTVFGFLAHPELTKESPHHASGNYGLMDQIAALKWVRDSVSRFGGDPGNVTIFGQSAGAVDVNVLMTSPQAKGLYRRVIAESGTVTRAPDDATMRMTGLGAVMSPRSGDTYSDALTLAQAEEIGARLFPGSLKELRAMAAADLLKITAAPRMSIGPANGIIVDGWIIPKSPAEVFAEGQEQQISLLIGNNSRERTPPQISEEDFMAAIRAMYGPIANRALSLYSLAASGDPLYGAAAAQWVVDTMYRCPVVVQLNWHAAAGNTGYEYQFDRAAPGREAAGATHGAEVRYVFGNLGTNYAAADREISVAIQQYWTNFAKTGDPNGAGLPRWPKYDAAAGGYIEFTDNGPLAREGLRRPFCDIYVDNAKRLLAR
jgi:para-nitrobenzyl esterase